MLASQYCSVKERDGILFACKTTLLANVIVIISVLKWIEFLAWIYEVSGLMNSFSIAAIFGFPVLYADATSFKMIFEIIKFKKILNP